MKSTLLLVVVGFCAKSTAILQLLLSEDETLLIGRNAVLVMDLHPSAKVSYEVESRLILDVIIRWSATDVI